MAYATLLEPFTKLVEVSIPGTLKNPHTKAVLQAGRPSLITAQAAKHKDCSHVVGDAVGGGFLAVAAAPKGRFAGVDTWSVVVVVSNSRGFVTLRGLKGWEFDRLAEESYNAVHTFTEAVAVREAKAAADAGVGGRPALSKAHTALQEWATGLAESWAGRVTRPVADGGLGLPPGLYSEAGVFPAGDVLPPATPLNPGNRLHAFLSRRAAARSTEAGAGAVRAVPPVPIVGLAEAGEALDGSRHSSRSAGSVASAVKRKAAGLVELGLPADLARVLAEGGVGADDIMGDFVSREECYMLAAPERGPLGQERRAAARAVRRS